MSNKNRDGKRQARERLAEERAKRQRQEARRKRLTVGGAVIAVIAIAVVIGIVVSSMNSNNASASAFPGADSHAGMSTVPGALAKADTNNLPGTGGGGGQTADGLVLAYGPASAPLKVTIFEDFRCPVCDEFEKAGNGALLEDYARAGKVQLQFHIVSFIDRNDPGNGSKNAANAAACAYAEGPDYFIQLHNVLYANQPDETNDAFASNQTLLNLAKKVPNLVTPTFTACVEQHSFAPWVYAVQKDFDRRTSDQSTGITGTPTVFLGTTQVQGNALQSASAFQQQLNSALTAQGVQLPNPLPTPTAIPAPTAPSAPPSAIPSVTPTATTSS